MNAGTDDVGRNALAGIQLAAGAQFDDRFTHSLSAFRDRLDLEIIELIVEAHDFVDGMEGSIDRTVSQRDSLKDLAVFAKLHMSGRIDLIAGIDYVGDQFISRRNLQCC